MISVDRLPLDEFPFWIGGQSEPLEQNSGFLTGRQQSFLGEARDFLKIEYFFIKGLFCCTNLHKFLQIRHMLARYTRPKQATQKDEDNIK